MCLLHTVDARKHNEFSVTKIMFNDIKKILLYLRMFCMKPV